jgi:hypothetical protein
MSVQAREPAASNKSSPASAGTARPMQPAAVKSITQDCTDAAGRARLWRATLRAKL